MGDSRQINFEMDLENLKRLVLPMFILKVVSSSKIKEGMSGTGIANDIKQTWGQTYTDYAADTEMQRGDYGEFKIYFPVLYPMLSYLCDQGWLKRNPDSKLYTITKNGLKKHKKWRAHLKLIDAFYEIPPSLIEYYNSTKPTKTKKSSKK